MDDVKQATRDLRGTAVAIVDAPARRERWMIGLLGTITALLLVLVAGLGAGAFWAWHQYQAAQAALADLHASMGKEGSGLKHDLKAAQAELKASIKTGQALTQDLLRRQAALGADLAAATRHVEALQGRLDGRRAGFGEIPKDPFLKADYAIRMSQLALDEAMTINRHVAATQQALAKNLALSPAQRRLMRQLRE